MASHRLKRKTSQTQSAASPEWDGRNWGFGMCAYNTMAQQTQICAGMPDLANAWSCDSCLSRSFRVCVMTAGSGLLAGYKAALASNIQGMFFKILQESDAGRGHHPRWRRRDTTQAGLRSGPRTSCASAPFGSLPPPHPSSWESAVCGS